MSAADGSLRRFVEKQPKRLTGADITFISRHVISALSYLHGQKIIHRDIKPENILYTNTKPDVTFSLADFGLSKEKNFSTTWVGTPLYMAPEVYCGTQQDFGVDIWSLGVVIYEMLTGIALNELPGLTDELFRSGQWCGGLEKTCQGGGDLARMLTLSVERRITTGECFASPTFPRLPDALPPPVIRISPQALSIPTLPSTPNQYRRGSPIVIGSAAQQRKEKALELLQAQGRRQLRPRPVMS